MHLRAIALLYAVLIPQLASAQSCDLVKVTRDLRNLLPQIIHEELESPFTRQEDAEILRCLYSPESGYAIRLRVNWLGGLSGDYYEAIGDLDIVGSSYDWATLSANDNLKGWWIVNDMMDSMAEEMRRNSG